MAVGWSGYFNDFMAKQLGMPIPAAFDGAPFKLDRLRTISWRPAPISICPPWCWSALVTFVLIVGVKHRAPISTTLMVAIKLTIVLVVIFVCFSHIVPANHVPFIPPNTGTFGHFGWTGVFRATGVIFFAYIGFDAVSVAAQEAQESAARHSASASWDR